ncbi:G-type lectin S-receptor-like serine/threonine-protein kinase B120 [Lycium ferocissimum]|uniref:G-type lectin S-receptor-like serine/threonine-protein kinase B120 n=1 Tax=Lycium ferocissimum TaxID=112874 RepID=UPI002815D0EE|nr:G-type lectin S-receptor-like serine/threonine-protein kinase B120 [Lycium ferocissimum]
MATGFRLPIWFVFLFVLSCFSSFCLAGDRFTLGETLKDGDNITSKEGKFVLGFFSPTTGSSKRYLGIWYADIKVKTVIWVANRNKPVHDKNGTFLIDKIGNLVVKNGHGDLLWSSNVSVETRNSTACIMDDGNLVIRNNDRDATRLNSALWESFLHPTDTFLPGMRVLMERQGNERKVLSSWTNESDPSPGRYSLGVDPRGAPQIVIWDGSDRRWRSGQFDGVEFTGIPNVTRSILFSGFKINNDDDGRLFFTYASSNTSALVRFQLTVTGNELQQRWDEGKGRWNTLQSRPAGGCDLYNFCGNFAKCNKEVCLCLEGFVPRVPEQWHAGNRRGGCVRRTELECRRSNSSVLRNNSGKNDRFRAFQRVKLPDYADIADGNIEECKIRCLDDCSCNAYAFVRVINCMIWRDDLVDIEHFEEGGNTLYVRLDPSEFGKKNRTIKIVVISILVALALVVMVAVWLVCRYKARKLESKRTNEIPKNHLVRSGEFSTEFSGPGDLNAEGHQGNGSELSFFSFSMVATATGDFSLANKLGQGGFGPVYKGRLPCGQEVAVKRLSQMSGQGVEEFKNEITLIAKLQHRNLVRLLGCSVEGEEKMLIYEYMPNKSLDTFLFDTVRKSQLDWRKRFNIIEGIARGLLYLHRDSRLRIIHRDLKASNILLDEEMTPKISDFGMARIFGGNQNEANTNRVVGTYGYMAPEYAMGGLFSGKSDVYSFGILLLEIICGRRNTSFRTDEHSGIIEYAWEKWDEGRPMDIVDRSIWDGCQHDEALRCIHLALLCVQDLAVHRPNMSSVVLMLETDNVRLPLPRQPTYTSMGRSVDEDVWQGNQDPSSNNVTISVLIGR